MGRKALAVRADCFVCGPLAHPALLRALVPSGAGATAAVLADHALAACWDGLAAAPIGAAGQQVNGTVVPALTEAERKPLEVFAAGLGLQAQLVSVTLADGGQRPAIAYLGREAGGDWDAALWLRDHSETCLAAAHDLVRLIGQQPAETLIARFTLMLARAASRVRAARSAPTALRHSAQAGDVAVADLREPYARFFAMEEYDLAFRRFNGTTSPVVTRATFMASDAVTVLPYDPRRDRVLVIDQFRAGPLARGDLQPWQVEAIAGRIDAGETPEAAARREAEEEAGLTLSALEPVAAYYPSPGCSAEYLYSFVAITDLPDGVAGVFGLEGEAEDIRGHLISFDQLMALVASGEIGNAPTILTAHWLALHRNRLRGL